MKAEMVSEMSKILSSRTRLSARQGFISLSVAAKCQILIMQTLLFLAYSYHLQISFTTAQVGATYTTALSQKEYREKGNLHDQDSDSRRA
jgi:hypothetical protein